MVDRGAKQIPKRGQGVTPPSPPVTGLDEKGPPAVEAAPASEVQPVEAAVAAEAVVETPPRPEPPPALPQEPIARVEPPHKPRLVLPMAVAALVGGIIGTAGGYIAPRFLPSPTTATLSDVQDLRARMDTLVNRPAPVAPQGVPEGVEQRLAQSEATLRQEIARLIAQVEALSSRTFAGATENAPDIAALRERLSAFDGQIRSQGETLRETVSTLQARSADLGTRLDQITARLQANAGAPLYVATMGLAQAVEQGRGYARELAVLETLGVPADRLTALKSFAAEGLPSAAVLRERLKSLVDAVQPAAGSAQPVRPEGALGWAQSLVQVRSTTAPRSSPFAALDQALAGGDWRGAMSALAALPEAQRRALDPLNKTLADRVAALTALSALQTAAAEGLRRPAP